MLSAARRDSHPGLNELDLGVKTTVIDFARSRVLNAQSDQGTLQDVLGKNEASIAMISDADHELIISLVFKDPTTITNVQFICGEQPDENHSGPKHVDLYSNTDDLDFDEVNAVPPAQSIDLALADLKNSSHRIAMKGTKFQKCSSLQIYISSNQDSSDLTYMNGVKIYGFVCPPYTKDHLIMN